MAFDLPQLVGTNRNIALLIDADNVSHAAIAGIVAELSKYGTANIRRAYGDWTQSNMKGWKDRLHEFAIRPIQQFSYTRGKNATDMALVIDALELLYTQKLDAFCIASSDADFTPVVMHLRANGHDVFGFGARKTPESFVNACTGFLYLEGLAIDNPIDATACSKNADRKKFCGPTSPLQKQPAQANSSLSKDLKLITTLQGAFKACVRDDGWALLSAVGSAAKRQAPIDPRNFGVKNFAALFDAVGCFEIHRSECGQPYVAEKYNWERAKLPKI